MCDRTQGIGMGGGHMDRAMNCRAGKYTRKGEESRYVRFCLHRSEGPLPPSSHQSGKAPWRSHFGSCTGGAAGQAKANQGLPRFMLPTHWMVTTALRASQALTVYQGLNGGYLNSFALMLMTLRGVGGPYHPYFTDEESSRKLSIWAALKVNSRTNLTPRSF